MREMGATGVFRNLAFQDIAEEAVVTPKKAVPSSTKAKGILAPSNKHESSSEPANESEP